MGDEGKEYFDIRLSVEKLLQDAQAVIDIIDNIGKEASNTGSRMDTSFGKAGKSADDLSGKTHDVSDAAEAAGKAAEEMSGSTQEAAERMDDASKSAEKESVAIDGVVSSIEKLVEGQQKQIDVLNEINEKTEKHVDKSKRLTDEQKKQSDLLVKLMGGQESYNKIMSALPPELQSAISGMQGLIASSQAFIATPIGMVIAALGTSIALLASYFRSAKDGEDEFVEISAYAKGVLSALNDEAVDAGRKLYHLFDDPKKSAIDFINNALAPMANRLLSLQKLLLGTADIMKIVFTSDESSTKSWEKIKSIIAENAKAAVGVVKGVNIDAVGESLDKINKKAERRVAIDKDAAALAHEEDEYMVRRVEIERELERLRTKRMSAGPAEKLKIEAEARKLNNELTSKQIEFAKRELEIAERMKDNSSTSYEDERKVYEAQAKLIQVEIEGERRMMSFVRAANSASNSIQNAAVRNAKEEAKAANNIRMLQEKQKSNEEREAKRLALEVKKAEVEGWEEGHAKVMKMLLLQGEEELLAVQQKKSDALMKKISDAQQLFMADKGNAGKVFDMSSVEFTAEENAKWDEYIEAVKKKIAKAEADVIEAERDSMNSYLKDFGTYQERMLAVQEIYAKKRKEAKTEGERLLYTQQEKAEIESIKKEFGTSAQAFADLFADASDKSVKSIQRIIDKYKLLMEWMQQGGATGGESLINPKTGKVYKINTDTKKAEADIKHLVNEIESVDDTSIQIKTDTSRSQKDVAKLLDSIANVKDKEIKLIADDAAAKESIAEIAHQLAGVEGAEITISADSEDAQKKIAELSQSIGEIEEGNLTISLDVLGAEKIDEIGKTLAAVENTTITVKADSEDAQNKIRNILDKAEGLQGIELSISVDDKDAKTQISEVSGELAGLQGVEISVKANTAEAENQLKNLGVTIKGISVQDLKDAGITDEEIARIKKGEVSLKDFADQYDKLRQMIADKSPWRSFQSEIEEAVKKLKNGDIAEGISGIASATRKFLPAAKEFAKSLGNLFGDSKMKDLDDIVSAVDGLSQAASGAAQALNGDIIGGTMAAVNGLSTLKNALTSLHDGKHEKRIEKLQKNIDNLEEAYKDLERAVERTYGKTKQTNIGLEIASKQKQIELIEQQIQEERDKKKTDNKKIEEWQKEIKDIKREVDDLKESAQDAIFGEDIQSSIQNFADAYAQAWDAGTSKAKAAKDIVRDMMKKMVSENIKDFLEQSKSMEQLRKKMQEFFADGVFSNFEQKYIYQMADDLQKELDEKFGWADSLYKSGTQQGGSIGGFAQASQDSIDELNGRFTSIQMNTGAIAGQMNQIHADAQVRASYLLDIRANTEQSMNIGLQALDHLAAIEKNTGELYEMNERLDRIERNTRNLS